MSLVRLPWNNTENNSYLYLRQFTWPRYILCFMITQWSKNIISITIITTNSKDKAITNKVTCPVTMSETSSCSRNATLGSKKKKKFTFPNLSCSGVCSCDWILVYGMRVELNYAICVARFLKVGLSYVLTLSLFNHQVCVYVLSCVWLFVTPWTVTCQAPQSLELSRQEYWSGLPFPPLGIFLTQGLNLHLLCLLHCQADFFFFLTTEQTWKLQQSGTGDNKALSFLRPQDGRKWITTRRKAPHLTSRSIYLGLLCEWKINLLCILRSICYGKWHYPNWYVTQLVSGGDNF